MFGILFAGLMSSLALVGLGSSRKSDSDVDGSPAATETKRDNNPNKDAEDTSPDTAKATKDAAQKPAAVEIKYLDPAETSASKVQKSGGDETSTGSKAPAPTETNTPADAPVSDPAPVETNTSTEAPVSDPAPAETNTPAEAPVSEPGPAPAPPTPNSTLAEGEVMAGRVTTLKLQEEDVSSVRMLAGPEFGNVSVNPDNTLAVVLTHDHTQTGSIKFAYEVTYKDGSTQQFESEQTVVPGTQAQGWGMGEHYMLETDANGDVIVETGEDHRAVYISGSDDALSRADIAAIENLKVSDISDIWLANNPEYGGSEDMALDSDAGMGLWYTMQQYNTESSNWLLFEKGYTYKDLGRVILGTSGEDELHPMHITSYGTGDAPVLDAYVRIFQVESENIVFSDVRFAGPIQSLTGSNILFDNVQFDDEVAIQNGDGITIRNSIQYDVVREDPADGSDYFSAHLDRISGLYMSGSNDVLLEGNLWDKNGWDEGYSYDGLAEDGQAPSKYSHNVYLQNDTFDVTFRDNITMRSASVGAQIRGGGFIEDNLFLDNNIGVNFLGGVDAGDGTRTGTYSLFTDNVVTSAIFLDAVQIGAQAFGVDNYGDASTLNDNIITHLADPNNPDEQAAKPFSNGALHDNSSVYYDDTIIYNWGTGGLAAVKDTNIYGLDTALLDQTTIQNYAAQLLGDPNATITDLADYLRAQSDNDVSGISNADVINSFFQTNFGISSTARLDAETLRFIPNELADGVRWDNRMNWDTDDLPGTIDGDSVDLGGNWVVYGGTTQIKDFAFGDGGTLNVGSGKLQIDGTVSTGARGGTLNVDAAGQVWADGYADQSTLALNIDGGRFVNTGEVSGTTETKVTDGQSILATDNARFDVSAESRLDIIGSTAKVGFDGDQNGTAVLRFEEGSTLNMVADQNGFAEIEEFTSGRFDETGDVDSGINLDNAALQLDVTELGGTPGSFVLMGVDALIGDMDSVELKGLADTLAAELVVDYEKDTLTLNLTAAESGKSTFTLSTLGDETDGVAGTDLWQSLTEGMPLAEDLPLPEDEEDTTLELVA